MLVDRETFLAGVVCGRRAKGSPKVSKKYIPGYGMLGIDSAESWNTKKRSLLWLLRSIRITIDPAINHGKLVIRGLRYPVEMLLELPGSGMTIDLMLIFHAG